MLHDRAVSESDSRFLCVLRVFTCSCRRELYLRRLREGRVGAAGFKRVGFIDDRGILQADNEVER